MSLVCGADYFGSCGISAIQMTHPVLVAEGQDCSSVGMVLASCSGVEQDPSCRPRVAGGEVFRMG